MPTVVVGAVAAGFLGGSAFVATATSIFSLAAFGTSLILGGLSYALTPKPKKPSFDNGISNKGSTVAIRQPDLTRQFVYGHTRITRGYAHMQSTGLNGKLHMILMLCEGPLRAINEVWVNDYAIPNDWIDANGNVTQGRYKNKLTIRKHLGTDTQGADSVAVSNMEQWTADCRLAGIAYLYLIMTKDQDVYPTGVPNVSAIVEGPSVYDPRENEDVWSTNLALFSRHFIRDSRFGFKAMSDDLNETNMAAQANICDEMVDTEFDVTEVVSVNASNDLITLSGTVLKYQFGDRIQITSTVSAPGGLAVLTDYYVIPYQIKDTPRIGLATSLENAMLKDYIDITSAGSGIMTIVKNGEPRYHGSGVVDSETPLSETLNDLVTSMAGRAINTGGFWTLLAGAYRSPSLSLGIGDMRSGMSLKNSLTMAESFNVIKGLYISSVNLYQSSDYPSVVYSQFVQEDNDIESPKDVNLPFTNRATTAQRIAKIELFRGRQDIIFKSDFSTKALQLQPGDTTDLTIDKYGWEEKEFEITDFNLTAGSDGLFTTLTLRETAQAIYDWTEGEAIDFDPAPNTNLPDPFTVLVPTGVSYNSRSTMTEQDDQLFILVLQWSEHPDAFVVQYGDFELQFKLSDEVEWRPSFFVDGALTKTDVTTSSPNISYDLRIRARNNLGVRSEWVTIFNAIVGSSGGVGTTLDWETFSDPIGSGNFEDWETFSDPVGSGDAQDWGYFV